MSADRFTLDTNVLVCAVDRLAGAKHALAVEIVDRAAGCECLLTLQSLAEFYHAVTRKGIVPPRDAAAQIQDWMSVFPVVEADCAALERALKLSTARRLSIWDALIASTAEAAGCSTVVSQDMQDGQRLGNVVVRHPFAGDALSPRVSNLLDAPG